MSLTVQANQSFPKNIFKLIRIEDPELDLGKIENPIFDVAKAMRILPGAKKLSFVSDYQEMRAKAFAAFESGPLAANPLTLLMIGNVGSGKSTFLTELQRKRVQKGSPKMIVASTDDFLEQYDAYKWSCKRAYMEAEEHGTYDRAHEQLVAATREARPAAQLGGNLLGQEALDNGLPCAIEITGKDAGGIEYAEKIQARRPDMKTAIFVTTAEVSRAVCVDRWHNLKPFCVSPEQAVEDHKAVMENLPGFISALNGDVEIYARYSMNARPVLITSRANGLVREASANAAAEYESMTGYALPSLQKSEVTLTPEELVPTV